MTGQWRAAELEPESVANALRWYEEWIGPIPLGQGRNICRGGRSGSFEFLFCAPTNIEVDSWRDSLDGSVTMLRLFQATSFEQVSSQAPNRFGVGGTWTPVTVSFADDVLLKPRPKNAAASKSFYDRAHSFFADDLLRERGATEVWYPWVRQGDPSYHVYFVRNRIIETIYEFNIASGSIPTIPTFYYNGPRGNLPAVAERNLADPSKWFYTARLAKSKK